MVLEKYEDIAGFNLEGYYFRLYGGLGLSEFIPTKDSFEELPEKGGYMGVCFIIDNVEMILWVYQDGKIKTKKGVKKVKNESNEKQLAEILKEIFANELSYDISSYDIKLGMKSKPLFYQLFKYQINEYPLYTTHYILPKYEAELAEKADKEQIKVEATANVKNCVNCGWIISSDLTVCPKCHRSPREKFEGKNQ